MWPMSSSHLVFTAILSFTKPCAVVLASSTPMLQSCWAMLWLLKHCPAGYTATLLRNSGRNVTYVQIALDHHCPLSQNLKLLTDTIAFGSSITILQSWKHRKRCGPVLALWRFSFLLWTYSISRTKSNGLRRRLIFSFQLETLTSRISRLRPNLSFNCRNSTATAAAGTIFLDSFKTHDHPSHSHSSLNRIIIVK